MTAQKSVSSRLRHKLTLQQEVMTPDTGGGYVRTWADVADLWAEIIALTGSKQSAKGSGQETLVADQLQASISHRITLRYRDGVTAGMRLLFESRAFNIISIANPSEDREMLELLVREGAAA